MGHKHILAESRHYQVSHEFEVVFLLRKVGSFAPSKTEIVIGDFYGEPTSAIIDEKERFVIMIGCGMIIYNLMEPFESYPHGLQTGQWKALCQESDNYWCIESITQTGEGTFHFTVDPNSDEGGTYEFRLPELAIQKLR